jgi:hypothetical protein
VEILARLAFFGVSQVRTLFGAQDKLIAQHRRRNIVRKRIFKI